METHTAKDHEPAPTGAVGHKGKNHRWGMIACCIPMIVIAIILVATGVVGAGFILIAIGCTLAMALMMGGMDHGGNAK